MLFALAETEMNIWSGLVLSRLNLLGREERAEDLQKVAEEQRDAAIAEKDRALAVQQNLQELLDACREDVVGLKHQIEQLQSDLKTSRKETSQIKVQMQQKEIDWEHEMEDLRQQHRAAVDVLDGTHHCC